MSTRTSFARKALAALVAAVLATVMFAMPALAAPNWATYNPGNEDVTGDAPKTKDITVYGYVGEDGTINPGVPPTVTPHEVNVSVPTQMMWAAFESDAGAIDAPGYYIKNNSQTSDLKVTVTGFAATGADNTTIDPNLTLTLTGAELSTSASALVTTGSYLTANTTKATPTFAAGNTWNFNFGGTWAGIFGSTAYNPSYTMSFLFEK
jgi:hypothetical protein